MSRRARSSVELISLLRERTRIDPAIASSVFVTTFTDVCGFALLLGRGGWLLL